MGATERKKRGILCEGSIKPPLTQEQINGNINAVAQAVHFLRPVRPWLHINVYGSVYDEDSDDEDSYSELDDREVVWHFKHVAVSLQLPP